ncbi:hypothetical protein Barb7_00298 [Bacteroidales bacterium Barb7]|nr:hypothetical protein Barb7_00298 [Bacteroidales bacterium Barb7]
MIVEGDGAAARFSCLCAKQHRDDTVFVGRVFHKIVHQVNDIALCFRVNDFRLQFLHLGNIELQIMFRISHLVFQLELFQRLFRVVQVFQHIIDALFNEKHGFV